jgi:multisubunit Na+/H+ antiporter MnhE subunit
MSTFFIAVFAGLVWMSLSANFGWGSFAFGAVVALALGRFAGLRAHRRFGPLRALVLLWLGLRLLAVFLFELLVANIDQLRIVLAPRIDIQPGWIRFRSELETPAMRALLGAMVSLTPGSVTYEDMPSEEGGYICLHVLDLRDEDRLVALIRRRFEAPLHAMEVL